MNIVYNCHIPEVMGYAERGYCFRRGDDVFLMWDGYFYDLMQGMWTVYGREFDPEEPDLLYLGQVPLLEEWNKDWIGEDTPLTITELKATAKAFRDAVAQLRKSGPNLTDSPQHGEILAEFLEQAVTDGQSVHVEEVWG